MKKLIWTVAAITLQFGAGCGGGSSSTPDMAMPDLVAPPDLTMAVDMTPVSEDMTPVGDPSCEALLTCINGCIQTGGANVTACEQDCASVASTDSRNRYVAITACGFEACAPSADGGTSDGGAAPCTSPSNPSAACQQCVNDAVNTQHLCDTELEDCLNN